MKALKRKISKFLGLTILAAGVVASGVAKAQTATVQADLITTSAITAGTVSAMDFGEWFLVYGGVGTGVLTLTDDGSNSATATTTPAGSTFTNLTASTSEGQVDVTIPAPAVMTMTRSNTTDFTHGGLSLAAVTYRTATENGNIDSDASAGPVTVTTGGVAEAVKFGGNVAITATPADATHAATFDVTFSY